ncbi:hypothetical protein EBU99_06330 [bacterium]|nr:hypothetical protein [bacterium]
MNFGSLRHARRFASLVGISVVLFLSVTMLSCLKKNSKVNGELRSVTVRSRVDDSLELLLLKSLGINTTVRQIDLMVPLPSGANQAVLSVGGLEIQSEPAAAESIRKVLPLYSQVSVSRVNFSAATRGFPFLELFPPPVQVVLGKELRFASASAKMSSADALLSLLTSDAKQIRFIANAPQNVNIVLLDGVSFRTVGEFPASSKPANGNRRERNSGLAIGDLLVLSEPDGGVVKHAALWIDHDIYLEALPFGNALLFRFASYSQMLQELALRITTDARQLKFTAVRKAMRWTEIATRMRGFKDQTAMGQILIEADPQGRAVVTSAQGISLKSRQREPAGGAASQLSNPQ